MPKNSSAARRQSARRLAAAEGIPYTAALRRLAGQDAGTAPGRAAALALLEQHRQYPAEVACCQACRHVHLAHYGAGGHSHGCVACEQAGRVCPVYVPGGTPKLSSYTDPASADPAPCPWLCGHGLDEHSDGSGCYLCGCRLGAPGALPPGQVAYHGYPAVGPGERVVVIEAPPGSPVSLLPHLSPTEFAWGYAGAGPRDLARSLLVAALGPAAACLACHGAGRVLIGEGGREVPCGPALADEADPEAIVQCGHCDDGYRAVPYQLFKSRVVAGWGQDAEWVIDRGEIITWLRGADPELAAAAAAYP